MRRAGRAQPRCEILLQLLNGQSLARLMIVTLRGPAPEQRGNLRQRSSSMLRDRTVAGDREQSWCLIEIEDASVAGYVICEFRVPMG